MIHHNKCDICFLIVNTQNAAGQISAEVDLFNEDDTVDGSLEKLANLFKLSVNRVDVIIDHQDESVDILQNVNLKIGNINIEYHSARHLVYQGIENKHTHLCPKHLFWQYSFITYEKT